MIETTLHKKNIEHPNRKWIGIIITLTALLLTVASTNYLVDPTGLFHDDAKIMAGILLRGDAAFQYEGNVEERKLKYYLIEGMPKRTDCIALGPSLAACIFDDLTGEESFYNLAVNSGGYRDVYGILGTLETRGIKYDRVILCVDPYLFKASLTKDKSYHFFETSALYYRAILHGEKPNNPPQSRSDKKASRNWKELLSAGYFRDSASQYLEFLNEGKRLRSFERCGVVRDGYEQAYYMPDGSRVYAKDADSVAGVEIASQAEAYYLSSGAQFTGQIDEDLKEDFVRMAQRLASEQVDLELFMCPLPPSLWDYCSKDPSYTLLSEIENFTRMFAEQNGLKFTGGMDPYLLGVTDDDYYDCRHMKRDRLGKYFDFTR